MKTAIEIIHGKMLSQYTKSMSILDDALNYMIENNKSYTRTILIKDEFQSCDSIEIQAVLNEFTKLLLHNGYIISQKIDIDEMKDLEGNRLYGYVFLIFTDKVALDKYLDNGVNYKHKDAGKYRELDIYLYKRNQ